MATIAEIINHLESFAPKQFKDSWDNPGLHTGNLNWEVKAILLTVDFTEDVLDEAIEKQANLIIAHHPILFDRNIKSLTGSNNYEKVLIKAIKNDLALYSMHTNLDYWRDGINMQICKLIGLQNCKVFKPLKGHLRKLVTFVPHEYADKVRQAIFAAGAGHIGNYDSCSYNVKGEGTFRAKEGANPFVGEVGKIHFEPETRVETIFPKHLTNQIIKALLEAHPYEEVAYDIYPLENEYELAGIGIIGQFPEPISEEQFLQLIASKLDVPVLKHSKLTGKEIQKVVVCSGGCASLIDEVIAAGADAFLTGDSNYHYFFNAQGNLLMVEAGHYETEKFAIDVFYELLKEKFNTIPVLKITKNYNFVNYYIKNK